MLHGCKHSAKLLSGHNTERMLSLVGRSIKDYKNDHHHFSTTPKEAPFSPHCPSTISFIKMTKKNKKPRGARSCLSCVDWGRALVRKPKKKRNVYDWTYCRSNKTVWRMDTHSRVVTSPSSRRNVKYSAPLLLLLLLLL